MQIKVLVLYDSHGPLMDSLATEVAEGVSKVEAAQAIIRRIPQATRQDILAADAIIVGSPNWSGITGAFKSWLDDQGDLWEEGVLAGKVGAAFATGRGRHSGLEFTLLSLIHWMLACGMIIVGLPWSQRMRISGSYYGVTAAGEVSLEDREQAQQLGERVAHLAVRLVSGKDSSD